MGERLSGNNSQSHVFEFSGRYFSYFRICFVNLLLVIITFGIYSPWALMRCRRYIHNNMKLNGQSFSCEMTGADVFLSWVVLFFIYLSGIILIDTDNVFIGTVILILVIMSRPFMVVKSLQYQANMTSFNGVRFGFNCPMMQAWWEMFGLPMLMLLLWGFVMGIIWSLSGGFRHATTFSTMMFAVVGLSSLAVINGITYSKMMNIVGEDSRFGIHRFDVLIDVWRCIKLAVLAMLALIPFLLVVGFLFHEALVLILQLGKRDIIVEEAKLLLFEIKPRLIAIYFIYFLGLGVSTSYLIMAFRNYFLANLRLADDTIHFRSTLTFSGMVYHLGSLYILSAITLGLAYPLLRVWYLTWLAENTYVVGDLDALVMSNSDEAIDNGIGSRISRGVIPTLHFM